MSCRIKHLNIIDSCGTEFDKPCWNWPAPEGIIALDVYRPILLGAFNFADERRWNSELPTIDTPPMHRAIWAGNQCCPHAIMWTLTLAKRNNAHSKPTDTMIYWLINSRAEMINISPCRSLASACAVIDFWINHCFAADTNCVRE